MNLKQRSAETAAALARIVPLEHFLLRQPHIQATPKLHPPEFTGSEGNDQGASCTRPAFSASNNN
jgi:hypothetical protein